MRYFCVLIDLLKTLAPNAHVAHVAVVVVTRARGAMQNAPGEGEQVWDGELVLAGTHAQRATRCVAERYRARGRRALTDARFWPRRLLLPKTRVVRGVGVLAALRLPDTQWFARFSALQDNDRKSLRELAVCLAYRACAIEVQLPHGTLYVFAQSNLLLAAYRSAPASPSRGNAETTLWRGTLVIRSPNGDVALAVAALRPAGACVPSSYAAAHWPHTLVLSADKLRPRAEVWDALCTPWAQWHVRFVAIDKSPEWNGATQGDLSTITTEFDNRQVVGEVPCASVAGSLFIITSFLFPHGMSLLGVFRPVASPDRIGDDEF